MGTVFASHTWEVYFATWDCRKKVRGILSRSDKLSSGQSPVSFLADEAAIGEHIVEHEYKGVRLKTPDVVFEAHFGATAGADTTELGPGVRIKLLPLQARGSLDARCLAFVTEHLGRRPVLSTDQRIF